MTHGATIAPGMAARAARAGSRPSGKNIVICSDGTGNTAIKGRGTNVFKVFEAVDSHGHRQNPELVPQVTYYDDGVGTESLKYVRMVSGITGWGLSRNVRQLYLQLVRVYDPGDRIFLFGFSRGAFTVRTLAGFIATCGILDQSHFTADDELRVAVHAAYKEYRKKYRTKIQRVFKGPFTLEELVFSNRHRVRHPQLCPDGAVRIHFIGVWDTVDAVGLPIHAADVWNEWIYRFKFKDRTLSPLVDRACHALALDEERHSFAPILWDERDEANGRIEQVWFAGAHSNVGGGYPRQGMSLVALDWMMDRAEDAGLRFVTEERTYYRDHRNVDDKLYNPRAGLGVFYPWLPRDVARLAATHGIPPRTHASAYERIARGTEDYAPGNIPPTAEVVSTRGSAVDLDAIEKVVRTGDNAADHPIYAGLRPWILLGRTSYYVMLWTLLGVAASACTRLVHDAGGARGFVEWLASQRTGAVWQLLNVVVHSPLLASLLAGGLLLAFVLGWISDRRLAHARSEFWHRRQIALRTPLLLQTGPVAQGADERPR